MNDLPCSASIDLNNYMNEMEKPVRELCAVSEPERIDEDVISDFIDCVDSDNVVKTMEKCDIDLLREGIVEDFGYKGLVEAFVEHCTEFRKEFSYELEESFKRVNL